MPDDPRILESSYRESPAEEPSFALEVLATSLLAGGSAGAVAWAVAGERAGWYFAGAACLIMLCYRLYMWDRQGRAVHVVERTQRLAREEPPERIMVTAQANDVGPRSRRYQIGKWSFTRSEWRRLARAMGTHVTRRDLRDVRLDNGDRMFTNITETYPDVLEEMQRLGWVEGDDNRVTDAARGQFAEWGVSPAE